MLRGRLLNQISSVYVNPIPALSDQRSGTVEQAHAPRANQVDWSEQCTGRMLALGLRIQGTRMSKGRVCLVAGTFGGVMAFAAIAHPIAAAQQPGLMRGVQPPAQVAPVHYKGGSHCHPNCVLGQCRPVCHCKVGARWYTVQGTSCRGGASIQPPKVC
jgi:hypothetical protein